MTKFLFAGLSVAVGFGLISASAAQDARQPDEDTVILQPSSPWHVSFNNGICRLGRKFGHQGQEHLLLFDQRWPSSEFDLTATGPSLVRLATMNETSLQFANKHEFHKETPAFRSELDEWGPTISLPGASFPEEGEDASEERNSISVRPLRGRLDIELARTAEHIAIDQGGVRVLFETGGLSAPFKVLNDCTAHVLTTWGLDPDQQASLSRGAELLNGKPISKRILSHYPSEAMRNREQGTVDIALIVDVEGKMDSCLILNCSGFSTLDRAACQGMIRAEFTPALNAEGLPVRSYYTTSITYRLNR